MSCHVWINLPNPRLSIFDLNAHVKVSWLFAGIENVISWFEICCGLQIRLGCNKKCGRTIPWWPWRYLDFERSMIARRNFRAMRLDIRQPCRKPTPNIIDFRLVHVCWWNIDCAVWISPFCFRHIVSLGRAQKWNPILSWRTLNKWTPYRKPKNVSRKFYPDNKLHEYLSQNAPVQFRFEI